MNILEQLRVGHGHDIHALIPGRELRLAGVHIDTSDVGFDTHSDGDVISHALIDALAGAMADGDLGTHFPENDPEAEDARSLDFVDEFAEYVRSSGYRIINIDVFATLGTVRLRPFIERMRANLADVLDLDLSVVSVKSRSHDGLAEVGRGEACSATATVLLYKMAPGM